MLLSKDKHNCYGCLVPAVWQQQLRIPRQYPGEMEPLGESGGSIKRDFFFYFLLFFLRVLVFAPTCFRSNASFFGNNCLLSCLYCRFVFTWITQASPSYNLTLADSIKKINCPQKNVDNTPMLGCEWFILPFGETYFHKPIP